MREREAVLKQYGTASCVKGDECTDFDCVALRDMADEIVRLRAVQDAREAVVRDAVAFVGALEAYHAMVNGNEGAYLNNLGESEDRLKQSVRHLATLTETEGATNA
jgi:hypothetical protein